MEQKSNNDHHPGRWHRWVGDRETRTPLAAAQSPATSSLLLSCCCCCARTDWQSWQNWSAHAIQVLAIFCRPIHLSVHDSPSDLRSRRSTGCQRKLIRIKVWCGTMSWKVRAVPRSVPCASLRLRSINVHSEFRWGWWDCKAHFHERRSVIGPWTDWTSSGDA